MSGGRLPADGHTVVAVANPLRSLSGDAAYVRAFLETLSGPVVLVGHSYGGAVINNAATGVANVEAFVYINAYAPDEGQTPTALAGPDSALSADPPTIFDFVPATLPPGPATDLYLKRSTVFASFATGLSEQGGFSWGWGGGWVDDGGRSAPGGSSALVTGRIDRAGGRWLGSATVWAARVADRPLSPPVA